MATLFSKEPFAAAFGKKAWIAWYRGLSYLIIRIILLRRSKGPHVTPAKINIEPKSYCLED